MAGPKNGEGPGGNAQNGGSGDGQTPRYRSQDWWDNPDQPDMTALYLERYLNFGLTREELQSGRPIVGIAQTGSDIAPCNRHHLRLAERVRQGVRDAGGVPLEFPVHPIQETGKRPTAALDRNLAYLSLVETLYGYPLDGVVLTTGCDKTTPACLMAAATVDLPAVVLSGGPMLDGHWKGELAGSGAIIWKARELYQRGEIGYDEFMEMAAASAPSEGHCNTMGTALSMNVMAEALGMSLPGCAAIPAPHRARAQMAYRTGEAAVFAIKNGLRPSRILTKAAFQNAITVTSAVGGSSNCPPHLSAIARHTGVDVGIDDWEAAHVVPLLVDCQPAGRVLGEGFYRGGGAPAVMKDALDAGRLDGSALTVNGRTVAENLAEVPTPDREVIRSWSAPLREHAGFIVMRGNLFDAAVLKTSVIDDAFRARYLANPDDPDAFEGRAIVFEGPEDYHHRINDPDLAIDSDCILVIRNCGPVGYPGSAEVVNMLPPDYLLKQGVSSLPCIGDGRQSGTSGSPSLLNASPEAAVGGGLGLLKTGDRVRVDLKRQRTDMLVDDAELDRRRAAFTPNIPEDQTPWQRIYRRHVGQLASGACLEDAVDFLQIAQRFGTPRHSH